MGTILRPFSNQLNPKRQVPMGYLSIDWSHPLAQDLIGCWVPGVMGGIDVTGQAPTLIPEAKAVFAASHEGPGLKSTVSAGGMFGLVANSPFTNWTNLSLYYRGLFLGNGGGFTTNDTLVGISYTDTDSNPYYVVQIAATSSVSIDSYWNHGGTDANAGFTQNVGAGQTALSLGSTLPVGGTVQNYKYGVLHGSNSFGATAPHSANSYLCIGDWKPVPTRPSFCICNIVCFWNRILSSAEMAWIDQDPYCFLLSDEIELSAITPIIYNLLGQAIF